MPSSFQHPNLCTCCSSLPHRLLCIGWDPASMAPPPAQGVLILCPTLHPGLVAPTSTSELLPLLDSCPAGAAFSSCGHHPPPPRECTWLYYTEWRRRPAQGIHSESGQLETSLKDSGCAGNHRAMYNEVLIVQGRQLGREVLSHWPCSLDN